ncbi:MAG: hypothetical protein AABW92_04050 [Nanoarchaeota archaeon]
MFQWQHPRINLTAMINLFYLHDERDTEVSQLERQGEYMKADETNR